METYLIRTFGCQMNKHDSERVAGLLRAELALAGRLCRGRRRDRLHDVLRARERRRALAGPGRLTQGAQDGTGRGPIIAVGGCIGQRDGERLLEQLPHVDVVFGTHNVSHLPALIQAVIDQRTAASRGPRRVHGVRERSAQRAGAPLARVGTDHRRVRQLLHVLRRALRARPRAEPLSR